MTSERHRHFERPTGERQRFPIVGRVLYFISMTGIALLAGALGCILAFTYLAPDFYATNVPQDPIVDPAADIYHESLVLREQPRSLGLLVHMQPAIQGSNEAYETRIDPSRVIIPVAAVTSDGWFVTSVYPKLVPEGAYEIVLAGQRYSVDRVLTDAFSGMQAVHIAALTTPVTMIAQTPGLGAWAGVPLLEDIPNRFFAQGVIGNRYAGITEMRGLIRDSRVFSDFTELLGAADLTMGVPLMAQGGSFIGLGLTLSNGTASFIPAWAVVQAFERMLQDRMYADLGVYYVVPGASSGSSFGAVLYHPDFQAVRNGSPAARAGLQAGDILVAINGRALTEEVSLLALWGRYQTAEEITFTIMRQGERLDLPLPHQ